MAMTPTGTRVKPAPRPQPQRSAEFAHLTLEALRAHRRSLSDEEARVSYWRRLVQARLDLLREAARSGSTDGRVESLRAALTEVRPLGGRTSHQDLLPPDAAPPLPDLDRLWARQPLPADPADAANLGKDLAFAELQLSAYRNALHRRLELATGELIARYHEDPLLCLCALPLADPGRRAS